MIQRNVNIRNLDFRRLSGQVSSQETFEAMAESRGQDNSAVREAHTGGEEMTNPPGKSFVDIRRQGQHPPGPDLEQAEPDPLALWALPYS